MPDSLGGWLGLFLLVVGLSLVLYVVLTWSTDRQNSRNPDSLDDLSEDIEESKRGKGKSRSIDKRIKELSRKIEHLTSLVKALERGDSPELRGFIRDEVRAQVRDVQAQVRDVQARVREVQVRENVQVPERGKGDPKTISQNSPANTDSQSNRSLELRRGGADSSSKALLPEWQRIANIYNEVPSTLRSSYQVSEFTVLNMQAMGKDESLKPEYGFDEQGEYWFVKVPATEGLGFAVPRPKQNYNIGQFKSGGFDRVFNCGDIKQGLRYRKLSVIQPAEFKESGSGVLLFEKKGTLEFSDGEEEI